MNCIVIVQSIAQLADMYPRHEWEEIAACCDATICLGVNDLTSAKFVSDKMWYDNNPCHQQPAAADTAFFAGCEPVPPVLTNTK